MEESSLQMELNADSNKLNLSKQASLSTSAEATTEASRQQAAGNALVFTSRRLKKKETSLY
jgi:hypothetical protein